MTTPTQHRRRTRLLTTATAIAAAVALTASACGGGAAQTQDDSQGQGEMPTVVFGATTTPSSIGTVAAVIQRHNLDTKNGVRFDIKHFSPANADIALLSGQTDVGYFSYVSWASSTEKQRKLDLLAPLQAEHSALLVQEDSPYHSLRDLIGKKIAILPPVSSQNNDFDLLLAKRGLSMKRDFHMVTGPPPALESFLKRGQVAASVLFEPNVTRVLATGNFRSLLTLNGNWKELTGNPLYMLAISANHEWAQAHPQAAAAAVQTVQDAITMLAQGGFQFYKGLADVLRLDTRKEIMIASKRMSAIYTPIPAAKAESEVRKQLEAAAQYGIIPEVPQQIFTPIKAYK